MRQRRLRPGVRLIAVDGAEGSPQAALKAGLKKLRERVEQLREWNLKSGGRAQGPMTADMRALRAWITRGQEDQESQEPEHEAAATESEPPAAPEPEPEPEDFAITLRFTDAGSDAAEGAGALGALAPPPVPRVFTGESRTGEVWGGRELAEKFGDEEAGPGRFEKQCGEPRVARRMWAKLRAAIEGAGPAAVHP